MAEFPVVKSLRPIQLHQELDLSLPGKIVTIQFGNADADGICSSAVIVHEKGVAPEAIQAVVDAHVPKRSVQAFLADQEADALFDGSKWSLLTGAQKLDYLRLALQKLFMAVKR